MGIVPNQKKNVVLTEEEAGLEWQTKKHLANLKVDSDEL